MMVRHMRQVRFTIFVLAIFTSGCGLRHASPTPTATPTMPQKHTPAAATDTPALPTSTPQPSPTLVPSPTAVPTDPPVSAQAIIAVDNLADLQVVEQFQLDSGDLYVAGLDFSPGSDLLAVATERGQQIVWSLPDRELAYDFVTDSTDMGLAYPDVEFSPVDGRYLAATGRAWVEDYGEYWGAVRQWDLLEGGGEVRILTGTSHRSMMSVAFSPDGSSLAAGTQEGMGGGGSVKIWDTDSGELLHDLYTPDWLTSVSYAPAGTRLAGSSYGVVHRWALPDGSEIDTLELSESAIWEVAYAPDGRLLAARGEARVYLLDTHTGQVLYTIRCYEPCKGLAFSPDSSLLALAEDASVRFWDLASLLASGEGPAEATYTLDTPSPVVGLDFSPDSYLLGTVTAGGDVFIWEIK